MKTLKELFPDGFDIKVINRGSWGYQLELNGYQIPHAFSSDEIQTELECNKYIQNARKHGLQLNIRFVNVY